MYNVWEVMTSPTPSDANDWPSEARERNFIFRNQFLTDMFEGLGDRLPTKTFIRYHFINLLGDHGDWWMPQYSDRNYVEVFTMNQDWLIYEKLSNGLESCLIGMLDAIEQRTSKWNIQLVIL